MNETYAGLWKNVGMSGCAALRALNAYLAGNTSGNNDDFDTVEGLVELVSSITSDLKARKPSSACHVG